MKHIHTFESFVNEGQYINEATDYAVMLTGGSIGDKSRPRDAKGYAGTEVAPDEELLSQDKAKEKAKRMNANLSPGEKSHYNLKYVVVPAKDGKFIKESEETNEAIDTKYWLDYNVDSSRPEDPSGWSDKSKDFEDTFEDAVDEWNAEAERESMIKGKQIADIKKLAMEFFKIEKWISINVIHAMIAQES